MKQFTFRGKPICWIDEPKYVQVGEPRPCAFDPSMILTDEEFRGFNHYIQYDGTLYKQDEFFKAVFPEYKKHPYKVQFPDDTVFYLNNSQRARLQYEILAHHFDLVQVSDQDEEDLWNLCADRGLEPPCSTLIQRMRWKDGLRKMITFGAALDVRGKCNGVWCYRKELEEGRATFRGYPMDWDVWLKYVKGQIRFRHIIKIASKAKTPLFISYAQAMRDLYYHCQLHLTIPSDERETMGKWVWACVNLKDSPFPYTGDIPNSRLTFTIDYEKDVKIVAANDLKDPQAMAQYNREHNAEHNFELGKKQAQEKFSRLQGDEWTRPELRRQGYDDRQINRYCLYGWIERVERGLYRRVKQG